MTRSRYDRLADLMDQRRLDLDLDWNEVAEAAKISDATLRAVRNGRTQPSPRTIRGIERALRWEHGSFQSVLDDGDPVPAGTRRPAGSAREDDQAAEDRLRAAEMAVIASGLSPETKEALLSIRGNLERWAAAQDEDRIRRVKKIIDIVEDSA